MSRPRDRPTRLHSRAPVSRLQRHSLAHATGPALTTLFRSSSLSVTGATAAKSDCRLMVALMNDKGAKRGASRPSVSDHPYVIRGLAARRAGTGVAPTRPTVDMRPDLASRLSSLFARTEHLVKAYVPTEDLRALRAAQEMVSYSTYLAGDLPLFGSVAMATDYHSACHTDQDFWYCHLTVRVSGNGDEGIALNQQLNPPPALAFLFPTMGVTVLLRPGDNLLFNPSVPHCCSPKYPFYDNMHVHLCSFYLSSKVVGGNDNSLSLTAEQVEFNSAAL